MRIAHRVQRPRHVLREAVNLRQDLLDRVLVEVGVGTAFPQQLTEPELLEEQKAEVAEVGLVAVDGLRHGIFS